MRILHISPYYAPAWQFGGVVRAVHGLATAQAAHGHTVTVLTTDALDRTHRLHQANETLDGVAVVRLRNWSSTLRGKANLSSPTAFDMVLRGLVGRGVDVIHMHELRTAEALLIPTETPLVVSPHGTLSQTTGRAMLKQVWDWALGGRILQKFNHICALNAHEAREAEEYWRALRVLFPGVSIIPNGIASDFSGQVAAADGSAFRVRYRIGDQGDNQADHLNSSVNNYRDNFPLVLFMGRLSERKGLHLLIPAFARIASQFEGAHLVIAGADEGALDGLRTQVTALNLAGRIIFTGHLDGADRLAALAAADIFCLPAEGEGQSVAVLEAMAAGLPLLITPGCHMPEVETHDAGFIVDREVGTLATGLHRLIDDQPMRVRMGQAGRAWVHAEFNWTGIVHSGSRAYQQAQEHFRAARLSHGGNN